MKMTPLRLAALEFAFLAGYPVHHDWQFKLQENRRASRARNPAYDVFVRAPGAARGRKIGTILLRAVYPG